VDEALLLGGRGLMKSATSVGRLVGVLVLLHFAGALIVPFVLLHPLVAPGFLQNAAGSSAQIRAAVLLFFIGSAMAIGIAIAVLPVLRRFSEAMALWLLAFAIAAFCLQSVDNAAILSMLSLSQRYATPGTANLDVFETLAVVVSSARRWAHYSSLLMVGSWIFLLHATLYRFSLVPRAIAAFGLIGSTLQISAVTLRGLLGYPPIMVLAMPLAPAYVGLAVWLIVKGIDDRHRPPQRESDAAVLAKA
jgi:Domain of unknown function (DUF4386)